MEYSRHGTSEQLELYVLGRLGPDDSDRLEEHLLVCTTCRRQTEQLHHYTLGMKEALREDRARQEKPVTDWFGWLRQPSFAFATGLTVLFLVVLGAVYSRSGSRDIVPVASIQLSAMRGDKTGAPRAKKLEITLLDAPASGGPYKVEVVDGTGKQLWTGTGTPLEKGLGVIITAPEAGDYFLRLYGSDSSLIHEYGLRVDK